MSTPETFNVFKRYFPRSLYTKIIKYVTAQVNRHFRCTLSWDFCKTKLDQLDLTRCRADLINLYTDIKFTESNVNVFHISENCKSSYVFEPNHSNTNRMVYNFMTHLYQRSILASLIKYILLQPLLHQFETSDLVPEKRGLFFNIKKRLDEIIFESVLLAFNGAKYDNYLLCNHLFIIFSKLRERIQIYKKGSAISTVKITIHKNLGMYDNKEIKKKQKVKLAKWPLNLYIKDVRDLVSATLSLDKVGQLFNLPVSKLCFPYEQATSIKVLKKTNSLHPYNDKFWNDNFTGKNTSLEKRLYAQSIFEAKKYTNLYEYGTYYLIQDCLLLHSVVNTLFRTHLQNSVNLFTRRIYSQSNLAYQQFFILEPARQIDKVLAPKKINNTFYNYVIKQAVTGGLCTSFVHKNVDQQTEINEHLNYFDNFNLDHEKWPNFSAIKPKSFHETACGINTIDIRSLYPSAAVKLLPVNSPLFYTRLTPEMAEKLDNKKVSYLFLQSLCQNAQTTGDFNHDIFKLFNKPPPFHTEYHAINWYLETLPKDIEIIRFQSSFTALGQLMFVTWPLDAFLSFKCPNSDTLYVHFIQYQSVYYHGHRANCNTKNDEKQQQQANDTMSTKIKIMQFMNNFIEHFNLNHISFEYIEISDCDFCYHKIPFKKPFLFNYNKQYTYRSFLNNIYSNKLTGFLVVKNLEIKKNCQNPILGFIIQKIEYDFKHLSNYTQNILKHFSKSPRVIAVHKAQNFMVISTEYFVWLYNMFGFENTPDIYHALLFQMDTYLKNSIEAKLKIRKDLKELIKTEKNVQLKQVYEIKAELIKLMVNSCYGFTLCNLTSTKFKAFENRCQPPRPRSIHLYNSCIKLTDNVYIVEMKKDVKEPFETMLGQVGSYILFNSKIILLKRLYFLLKYLNPSMAQLLYMDTDSAHFLVKHKMFEDNVDLDLKSQFKAEYDNHFDSGPKISGIWVHEGFFTSAYYIGEKSYILTNEDNNSHLSHMKGLNNYFQDKFLDEKIDIYKTPAISYNLFEKGSDFTIFKTYNNKNLFQNYMPIKRYFVCASGSLPLRL